MPNYETAEPDNKTRDQNFKKDMQRLGQDAGQLKRDVSAMAHDVVDAAKSGVCGATDTVARGWETAREKGLEAKDSLQHRIETRPFTSMGIAVGIGFLLGLVICRPRS